MVKHCRIDLSTWEVERFLCNKWEVGAADKHEGRLKAIVVEPLFQVKVAQGKGGPGEHTRRN